MAESATSSYSIRDGHSGRQAVPWLRIHLESTKALSNLALRLRLGPQIRAPKAPNRKAGPLSYFDIMELDRGANEGEGEPEA